MDHTLSLHSPSFGSCRDASLSVITDGQSGVIGFKAGLGNLRSLYLQGAAHLPSQEKKRHKTMTSVMPPMLSANGGCFWRSQADAFCRVQVKTMNVYNPLQSGHFAAILPGDGVAEMVATSSIYNFLNIYNTLLIGRLVLTWFPNPPEIIANPLR
jgi:hypothetical protein